jgi:hypothetical protein
MEFVRRLAAQAYLERCCCRRHLSSGGRAQKSPLMEDAGSLLLIVFSAIRLTKVTTARRAFGLERTRQRISIISRS